MEGILLFLNLLLPSGSTLPYNQVSSIIQQGYAGSSLVTEHLPDMCKTLHPITGTTKKEMSTRLETGCGSRVRGLGGQRGPWGLRDNGQSASAAIAGGWGREETKVIKIKQGWQ